MKKNGSQDLKYPIGVHNKACYKKSTTKINIKAHIWNSVRCTKLGLGSAGIVEGASMTS